MLKNCPECNSEFKSFDNSDDCFCANCVLFYNEQMKLVNVKDLKYQLDNLSKLTFNISIRNSKSSMQTIIDNIDLISRKYCK